MHRTAAGLTKSLHPPARPLAALGRLGLVIALGLLGVLPRSDALGQWQVARPGKTYLFPSDHRAHPGFQTEWWYFTGNLQTPEGEEFGYQITWFRQGLQPPGSGPPTRSRFIMRNIHFVHLAISDISGKRHRFAQVLRRGSHGEAGTGKGGEGNPLVWVGPCALKLDGKGGFRIVAADEGGSMALDLHLRPTREPVCNGIDGVSRKGPGTSNASHYYSLTRLETTGAIRIDNPISTKVTGLSWFDREWSTSALAENQVGWDWFALRLDDGSDLMIYQIRQADGTPDPFSSGTLRKPDGTTIHLASDAFQLQPGSTWKSRQSGGSYPVAWQITVPDENLDLKVSAAFDDQEVALFPVTYWEGAVRVEGSRSGHGYMELTGYAGEVPLH